MKLKAYENWIDSDFVSKDLKLELEGLSDEEVYDRFYKNLEFGTAGLRGVMGAGTNRMNEVTVALATQGFAYYLNEKFEEPTVAIAYDSRHNSAHFARVAALTFAANGIKAYMFNELQPTPILSYSMRKLKCVGGIVVTASHNKKQYNGYKVYNEFGGQMTSGIEKLISFINNISDFSEIKVIDESEAIERDLIEYIEDGFLDSYFEKVKNLVIKKDIIAENASDLEVIYTPLHGTGGVPIQKVLKELGFENLSVVKEQEAPNGDFPTVGYPNPEDPNAFKMAIGLAKSKSADIIIGTDPDGDRLGLVARDSAGEYRVINGNQIGILLTEYILKSYKELKEIPNNSYVVKTIVSSEAIEAIADSYNVKVLSTLTGFKNIAEQMREFTDIQGSKYLFGFEESHGYLAGDFVRDKDGVIACTLACEMALYYKTIGKTLFDVLDDIYKEYGYFKETTISIEIEGLEGIQKISKCMEELRSLDIKSICNKKLQNKYDFKDGIKFRGLDLPKSNVLKFEFEDNYTFMARPSGTEPKLKIYLFIKEISEELAEKEINVFKDEVMKIVNLFLV